MQHVAAKKGLVPLDPRCSRSWRPGRVKDCKLYDFESCPVPDWPLTCPFEVKERKQGCWRYFCPTPFPPAVLPLPPNPETTTSFSSSGPTTTTTASPTSSPSLTPAQVGAGAAIGIFFGVASVCIVVAGTIYYFCFMNDQQRQIFRTAIRNFFTTGSFFGRFPRRRQSDLSSTLEPLGHEHDSDLYGPQPQRDGPQPQQRDPVSKPAAAEPSNLKDWADTSISPYVRAWSRRHPHSDLSGPSRSLSVKPRSLFRG